MIIQCKECGTKYRFDKLQIEGEGVWVRCSRCEATFFQKNPLVEISSLMHSMEPEGEVTAEETEETDSALGEIEVESGEFEPTGKDDYRDVGEGIEVEWVEEEKAQVAGEAEAEDTVQVPTGEDDYRDAGEGRESEGGGEEEAGDRQKVLGEIEVESDEFEPTGEDVSRDTDGGRESEGVEEEARVAEDVESGDDVKEPTWEETYGDVGEITGGEGTRERQRVSEPWTFGDADEVIYSERITGRKRMRGLWTLVGKVLFYLVLLALLSGGVYLWLVPEARETVSKIASPWIEKIRGIEDSVEIEGTKETVLPKAEKMLGIKDKGVADEGLPELRVTLIDVGERFVKGWTGETIMVTEGSAVNANTLAVSNIRVRGKMLGSSGNVLSEAESNCGIILTDDELKSLTMDEIKKELSNPYGRDFRNAEIKPGDGIPFMLVFTMPAEEASELVVELMGIEAAKIK
ncbi:MAG: zinc-ribbon domain-containing protein [Syntrophales bacterium]|nr:zinc-ribbon domain-containing protein [Syntrophales bacterium]